LFDSHTHMGTARHSGRKVTSDDLLRDMDLHDVDLSMAIPYPVVDDYRGQHDVIGRAVQAHPDRLSGAACLNPFIARAEFRAEIRRCREQYGFTALKLQPQYHGLNPFLASSDFFFEAALENGMAVICHTGTGMPFSSPALCMMPARKFPGLKIVLAHCGGGIYVHEAMLAAVFCPNIFLEMSSLMPHHVREVLGQVPGDRLMIGSDLPESVDAEFGKILDMDIGDENKRNILSGTASRVFRA
jgi:uncharacterized protein